MPRNQEQWDKQTIEMVDALLTHGRILRDRVHAECRRLKRLPDNEWQWLSEEVQHARTDLRHSDAFRDLLYPRDNDTMDLIARAADLLRTRETDHE